MIKSNHLFDNNQKSWCDFSFHLGKKKFVVAWCTPDFFRREKADEIEDNSEDANTLVKSDSFITPVFSISFTKEAEDKVFVELVCEVSVVKEQDLEKLVNIVVNHFRLYKGI